MEADGGDCGHVLLLAFPAAQGHLNPMLQFGRRLAYHGLRPTLVTTRHLLAMVPRPVGPFRVAAISDGFDAGGMAACPDLDEYVRRLAAAGSDTLGALFRSEAAAGRPVRAGVRSAPPMGGPRGARRRHAHRGFLLATVRGGSHLRGGVHGPRRPAGPGRERVVNVFNFK